MENKSNKTFTHYDQLGSIGFVYSKYDEYIKYFINIEKIATRNTTIDDILS